MKAIFITLLDQLKEKVEEKFALTLLSRVLVRSQLHDLEVVYVRLVL